MFNKLLVTKLGSAQAQAKEIIDNIAMQMMSQPRNTHMYKYFIDRFNKIMEDNTYVYKRPFYTGKVMISINAKVQQDEDFLNF